MSMGVSVLDGQLTRTWKYETRTRGHTISLYHDTITGVRSAMVDYEDVPGSNGNSSLIMESRGHKIFFNIGSELSGCISITRTGFFGFQYGCTVNGQVIPEVTTTIENLEHDVYEVEVTETMQTPDEENSSHVAWYVVNVRRLKDNVLTRIHRRFRDFADCNSQVKQNLKGHALLTSIPAFPEKTLKLLVDHNDPHFIQDRVMGLNTYLKLLVNMPHICDMTCVKGFLGLMDRVKEFSIVFQSASLGLTMEAPCTITSIQNPELCQGVVPGDSISKINGVPVAAQGFNAIVTRLKYLPRPIIVHFIRFLSPSGEQVISSAGEVNTDKVELKTSSSTTPNHVGDPKNNNSNSTAESVAKNQDVFISANLTPNRSDQNQGGERNDVTNTDGPDPLAAAYDAINNSSVSDGNHDSNNNNGNGDATNPSANSAFMEESEEYVDLQLTSDNTSI